jgi:hypothetical protein
MEAYAPTTTNSTAPPRFRFLEAETMESVACKAEKEIKGKMSLLKF